MAFDGITVAALVKQFREALVGGRINKIAQTEEDELLLSMKNQGESYKLLMSANASLPLCYFTTESKMSPMTAPGFCMLLRKHIGTARIVEITQPDFERVIDFSLEHLDEMGDLKKKHLIIELMGKHSNIIFTDDTYKIIDAIKHVSGLVSSVREVLPGREYFIPKTMEKKNPITETQEQCILTLSKMQMPLYKAIYSAYTGVSPIAAQEIAYRSRVDADRAFCTLAESEQQELGKVFVSFFDKVKNGEFAPEVVYENGAPAEYMAVPLLIYAQAEKTTYENISALIGSYYAEKNQITRIRQRSNDLRHIVTTMLEKNVKKYDLQMKQLADTEKRETYKVYGELLNTYGYSAQLGDKSLKALNYYTNEEIVIPLDETLSASENAKKYFEKYGKLKRTREALSTLTQETYEEIEHLRSVLMELDLARKEEDLFEIRGEMYECGYIKSKGKAEKRRTVSTPLHYVTEDGFHIYVGKNNYQNDALTFAKGGGGDYWFHTKGIPGSHVVLRAEGREIPDRVYELAARLAAYYSKGKDQEKVEIDYTLRKNVKKPGGAKPGFVVYYTNYSMMIPPVIEGVTLVDF